MRRMNYYKNNRVSFVSFLGFIVFILVINSVLCCFTGKNYVSIVERKILATMGIYTEEVKSIELETDDWDTEGFGSWHIDKSAEWTSRSTAKVMFDLESTMTETERKKDVIFVLDTSDTMNDESEDRVSKLDRVKEDSIEVINYLFQDTENSVALITFNTDSTLLTGFTKDAEDIVKLINNLEATGSTNYNAAFESILKVVDGYEKKDDHDLVILFLTDGYPNTDCPNQVATYQILKELYPYAIVNGIQYEMGTEMAQDIVDVSDNQYIADMDNLYNVLFDASISPEPYEEFIIEDYINNDYFEVDSIDDIDVSIGSASITIEDGVQKIVWDLEGKFKVKAEASMTINLKLKDEYVENQGYYPTNKKENITSKLVDHDEIVINSTNTPVLKNYYDVIYDTNAPSGCSTNSDSKETYFVFDTVTKRSDELTCDGYSFKGWQIVDRGIYKYNDDVFIMPSYDVTIRGTWTSQEISKSMDGTVHEKTTLYKAVEKDALSNDGSALKYTGTGSSDYDYNVYYYQGAVTKNNVLFAGFCWQIVRTTDTGGVKMIYNGLPNSGVCDNTGEDSQLSTTSKFNSSRDSLSYVGYMYNTVYKTSNRDYTDWEFIYNKYSVNSSYNYYYATEYTYSNGVYTLVNPVQLGAFEGSFDQLAGKGYYTCKLTTTGTCSTIYYILYGNGVESMSGVVDYYMYGFDLRNNNSIDIYSKSLTIGSEMIDNGDGTYTLSGDIETINNFEWYDKYSSYLNHYMCDDLNSTTCESMNYIVSISGFGYVYENVENNYKYGNDVEYDTSTGTYKLIDTDTASILEFWDFSKNYNNLSKNHYTCFNTSGECEEVYYLTDYSNMNYIAMSPNAADYPYYITLSGGKKIEDALNEMLWDDDVNVTDSSVKTVIDDWYSTNMVNYTKYIEDTVYCNDRSTSSLGAWNPDGGSLGGWLYFSSNNWLTRGSLVCGNDTDKFTVSDTIGNGALTYPVGLLNVNEAYLAYRNSSYNTYYLNTGKNYWMLSPYYFGSYSNVIYSNDKGPYYNSTGVNTLMGVRPVISLVPGIEYTTGDGETDNPYVVSLE